MNQGWPWCERKKKEIGVKSIETWPRKSFWKEVGRKKDYSILDGRTAVSVKLVEGTENHRLYHCPEWHAVSRGIPEAFRKWEQKAKTSKK